MTRAVYFGRPNSGEAWEDIITIRTHILPLTVVKQRVGNFGRLRYMKGDFVTKEKKSILDNLLRYPTMLLSKFLNEVN